MGLIRKSLMLGTGGVIRGSSKKQRVGASIAHNTAVTARHTARSAQLLEAQNARAAEESRFRYDTDETYRAWVDEQAAKRAAAAAAAAQARADALERRRARRREQWSGLRHNSATTARLTGQYLVVAPIALIAFALTVTWVVLPLALLRRRSPAVVPLLSRALRPWISHRPESAGQMSAGDVDRVAASA